MGTVHQLGSQPDDSVMTTILRAIEGLQFGSVEIVIHEARIVQVERREKFRIGAPDTKRAR